MREKIEKLIKKMENDEDKFDEIDLHIELLLDKDLVGYDKDDAAMALGDYDDDRALDALIKCGSDSDFDDYVLESCGESIGEIWVKRDSFSLISYRRLTKYSQKGVYMTIRCVKPEWIEKYGLK